MSSKVRKILASAVILGSVAGGTAMAVAPAATASTVAYAPGTWYHM